MRAMGLILDEAGIDGPFCIFMAVRGLRKTERMRWAFPSADTIAFPRGMMTDRVNDQDVTERFYELVRRASIYG